QRGELEGQIRQSGLGDCVRLLGPLDDSELLALYRSAELFAMPNRTLPNGDTEGFGLVFLEANACGKPVVAGDAGGAVDAVINEVNGLLVDGEDVEAIAGAIVRLLTDATLYERLSAGATKIAAQSGWPARTATFTALCDRLAQSTPSPGADGDTAVLRADRQRK